MSEACAACNVAVPEASRWKGAALFVGAIFFCPCHLPATIGALAAVGGTAWLTGNPWLLYLVFGVVYLLVLGFGLKYLLRRRDEERARETLHAHHAPAAS